MSPKANRTLTIILAIHACLPPVEAAEDGFDEVLKPAFAQNCIKCHGMATPDVKVAALEKMVSGGHPVNTDFDIMGFYQDKIARKRWPARSDAELARIFVAGQAAKLVSASGAIKEATQEDYKAAQMKRAAKAKAALDALKNIPEVAALLSSPSEDNALKLMAAVKKMDLSGQVKLR